MSSFKTPLIIKVLPLPIKESPFVLYQKFEYYSELPLPGYETMIYIPAGFRTDFATIPRFLWGILPPYGRYGKAAVIHDFLCTAPHRFDYKMAADIFLEAMEVLGVPRWKRKLMASSVKRFGPKFEATHEQ